MAVATLALAPPASAEISSTPDDTFVTDGNVNAVVRTADRIYLGGEFNHVGPLTGPWVALSRSTGGVDAAMPQVAKPDSDAHVAAIVSDGEGGFYIGGTFTEVGGVARQNLAHILADKSVDPAWAPTASDNVRALALSGSTVYIGGDFNGAGAINGTVTRNYAAAVDATTGAATAWDPNVDNVVNAVDPSGLTVYVGGGFTQVNGNVPRNHAAAFDATTGTVTAWNPNVSSLVEALVVSGTTVYMGGNFAGPGSVNGSARDFAAAVDATTGTVTGWDPDFDSPVAALAVSGGTVYAGGSFSHVNGGTTRNRAAAVDATAGVATAWNPNANDTVDTLAVSGSTVYMGGSFKGPNSLNGTLTRNRLAAVNATTGAATAWAPSAGGTVEELAVAGSVVAAGGQFESMGPGARNNAAALDAADGTLAPWNPNIADEVIALALSGSTVYIGGAFSGTDSVNGNTARDFAAAVDATTGTATSWNPDLDGTVFVLAVSGSTVYIGGDFVQANGSNTRRRAAAVDATTGALTGWNPNANDPVRALAIAGSTVYMGGEFNGSDAINGNLPRVRLAAVDATTGTANGWAPSANGRIRALAVSGPTVYIGGDFDGPDSFNGNLERNGLAAVDATTGTATGWDPNGNDDTNELVVSGSIVYVGGDFSNLNNGTTRHHLAAVDATTGVVTAWNPDMSDAVGALALDGGGGVIAGGTFTRVGESFRQGIASFSEPPASSAAPVVSGTPAVGETLTCSLGGWAGTMPQSYAFQWRRDGVEIGGATAAAYTIVAADDHHALTCRVTGANLGGSGNATSTAVDVPRKFTLSVSKAGSGTVSSAPAGIDCGAACSASYDSGTNVVLTPTPAPGSKFDGWSGDCSGTGACTVAMTAARSVTATFSPIVTPPVGITKAATLARKTYTASAGGVVTLPIGNPNAVKADGSVALTAGRTRIGSKRFTVGAGGRKSVKVKLNRKGRALVRGRKRQVKAKIVLSANGTSKSVTRTIAIRGRK